MGTSLSVLEQLELANYLSDSDSRSLQEVPSSQQRSARIAWSPTGRFRSRVLLGGSWHPTPVQHEYVSETISFVILEWSCCSVDLEYSRSCKTADPALGVEKKEPTITTTSLRESSAHVHCGNVLLMRTIEELVYLGQLLIKQAFKREGLKGNAALRPDLLVSVMQYRPVTHATRMCGRR